MFENPGTIIKKISGFCFAIACVSSLICAIAFGKGKYGDFSAWTFIGILVGGILISWISSLLFYAFGDIAENIQKMAFYSEKTAKARATESSVESTSKPSTYTKVGIMNDNWICNNCGSKNDKSAICCKDCGEYK